MKCSWSCINLGFRFGMIGDMLNEASEIAALLQTTVTFEFNGNLITVKPDGSVSKKAL